MLLTIHEKWLECVLSVASCALVVITGDRYRGFLLQARSLLGAGRRVGRFIEPLPSGTQFLDCDGEGSHTAVTHDCGHPKQDVRFLWPTPRYDIGPIQFM